MEIDDHTTRTFIDRCGRRVASWTQGLDQTSDDRAVNSIICSVFAGVKSFPLERIMFQLWRPRAGTRLVLDCPGHAYAVLRSNPLLGDKYRSHCMRYQYSIDSVTEEVGNPPWIITGGPVATAFVNCFPEVVLDFKALQGSSPLVDVALECELTCCVMLPIFDCNSSSCLGVVECSAGHPRLLLPVFNEMKRELERKGLSVYHVQGSWPYKTISGDLEPLKIEIGKALKIACESHDLTLGQVWISYESENKHHETNTSQMKRMFLVKLSGYRVDSDDDRLSSVKELYDKLDVIPLKMGEGLAGKALQTHQPHLCRNIYKMGDNDNRGLFELLSANTKCASFVICLRSAHTEELDYAFEFFWPHRRNHFILLETLLSTLKKYLPSFKFASGEQLSDELFVADVESSSSGSGSTSNETITSVGVKRKFEGQSGLNQSNQCPLTGINNPKDDDDLPILAAYRNYDYLLFYLPSSSTVETVQEKLKAEFEMDPTRACHVKYEIYPHQWSDLVCLEKCMIIENTGFIKLRVQSDDRERGWRWKTNTEAIS